VPGLLAESELNALSAETETGLNALSPKLKLD
jgi:hypothetical protein